MRSASPAASHTWKNLSTSSSRMPSSSPTPGARIVRLIELLREAQEDRRRRDDGVGAVGAEVPRVAALAVRHRAHLLEERLRRRDVDGAPLGRAQVEQGLDVAAGADEHVHLAELRRGLAERAIDGLLEQALALAVDGLDALEVGLEHPHRAEGQGDREDGVPLLEEGELGRAAADVDEERAMVAERDAPRDRELDEARLLDALDRLDLDVRLALRPLDERGTVLGLADGARCDGAVRVHLVRGPSRCGTRAARRTPGRSTPGRDAPTGRPRRRGAPASAAWPDRARGPPPPDRAKGATGPSGRATAPTPRPRAAGARWTRRRWRRSAA